MRVFSRIVLEKTIAYILFTKDNMLYVYLLKGEDEFDVEEHYLDFLPFNTLKLPFNTISNTRNKFYDKLIRRGEFSD